MPVSEPDDLSGGLIATVELLSEMVFVASTCPGSAGVAAVSALMGDDATTSSGPPCVDVGTITFPVMPPLAAMERILDDIDSAAVTGHTVVDRSRVSVISTVLIPSGRLVRDAVMFLPGQFVIVGAQLTAVCTEVARTVKVVRVSSAAGV